MFTGFFSPMRTASLPATVLTPALRASASGFSIVLGSTEKISALPAFACAACCRQVELPCGVPKPAQTCADTPAAFAACRKPLLMYGVTGSEVTCAMNQTGFVTFLMSNAGPGEMNFGTPNRESRNFCAPATLALPTSLGAGGSLGSVSRRACDAPFCACAGCDEERVAAALTEATTRTIAVVATTAPSLRRRMGNERGTCSSLGFDAGREASAC